MVIQRKKSPAAEQKDRSDASWFYQFWPDIRKQLTASIIISLFASIGVLINTVYSHEKMKGEFADMKITVRKVDSLITFINAQNIQEQNITSEKDSIISLLLEQNQEFSNHITKK